MSDVFEVNIKGARTDTKSAAEAIAAVEAIGEGYVVKFADGTRSCGMWSLSDAGWQKHYIYDGHGNPIGPGKPE